MAGCAHCQAELPEDASFCEECGKPVKGSSGWGDARGPVDQVTPMSGLITPDPDANTRAGEAAQPTLEPGDEFGGRYTIEEVVGRGGMGVVYKALDNISNKSVALKLISTSYLGGEKAVNRLIDEGVMARDIRHPNVVAVYDVGLDKGQPFVAMEYIDGVSLRTWRGRKMQKDERVSLRVAARIICEMLDGLKAAHDAGVIHRDLKPENVILTAEPDDKKAPLKLLDFGIARASNNRSSVSSSTGGLGTPKYMAPEQETNPDAANASADLYSISVMLYELLVGVTPQKHWQPPSGGRSDVPQEIDRLILRGLSNDRTLRPQSAQQYRTELVAAVNRIPVAPPPPPPPPAPPPPPPPGNGPPLYWIVGGSAAAVVGLVVIIAAIDQLGRKGEIYCDPNDPEMAVYCTLPPIDGPENDPDGNIIPSPPPPPPPPPPPAWNEYLSGRWDDGLGGYYNIRVNPNGNFSGNGRIADGTNVGIRGNIANGNMSYTLNAAGMDVAAGTARQTDQCHFAFQTYSYGQLVGTGIFHVNHASTVTQCP